MRQLDAALNSSGTQRQASLLAPESSQDDLSHSRCVRAGRGGEAGAAAVTGMYELYCIGIDLYHERYHLPT